MNVALLVAMFGAGGASPYHDGRLTLFVLLSCACAAALGVGGAALYERVRDRKDTP